MGIKYSLDARCQKIVQMVINAQGYITIQEIANENHVSKRSVYYDVMKINEWLTSFSIDPITNVRNKGVRIKQHQIKSIRKVLKNVFHDIEYLFTPTQRVQIMICTLLIKTKEIYIEDFITLCKVSRNTIIKDLKIVTKELNKYSLNIAYETKRGYTITGDFTKKVTVFFLYFNNLIEYYRKGIIPLDNRQTIYQIDEKLNRIEGNLQTKYVSGILFALATFIASINTRSESINFNQKDIMDIEKSKEYQLVQKYFSDLRQEYQLYVALHLLGSRLQVLPMDVMVDSQDTTYDLAVSLVDAFSNVACLKFINREQVIKALFVHLKTSLYRYQYGIQLTNPMLQDIKKEYSELFEMSKKACEVLEKELKVPIPESEIAYITLHFGSNMVNNNGRVNELKIVVICPNGISTGNMLKAEIERMIPQATIIDTLMVSEFISTHNYDIVISTVEINEAPEALIVHPILTDIDRVSVLRRCMNYNNENTIQIQQIVELAKKYIPTSQIAAFKKELENYFVFATQVHTAPKHSFGLGLLHYMDDTHIMVCDIDYNWQEAIVFASVPLLDNDIIEEQYVDHIVKKCHEMGPYMFITNTVVLAHAGINDGVHHVGVSLAKFNVPIYFNEHRQAEIIIVLAATDQVSHIRILHDVMAIFGNQRNIDALLKTNTSKDILLQIETILRKEKEST